MRRRDFIGGLLAMTLGRSVDLGACGDKFLRVARSARFRRYAAVHRVRILIYRSRAVDASRNQRADGVEASRPQTCCPRSSRECPRLPRPPSTSSSRTIWTRIG